MANPVSSVPHVQQAAHVAQTAQTTKQAPPKAAGPQDKVSISKEGKAASQAQVIAKPQQASGDTNHDGDSK